MRISEVEIYRLSIPMEPFVIASGKMDYAQNVFIRVQTEAGLYGVGECSAFPMLMGETQDTCLLLAREFAKIWKGKDPLAMTERMAELDSYIAGNSTIKSAFDMALYDLSAKAAGQPLYKFLGGERREIITDMTVGLDTADRMAEKAWQLKEGGAEFLKVKLGENPQDDIARIREIRKAVGFDIPMRIDANQGWSFDQAVEALTGLGPYKVQLCEQPMRSHKDHLLIELRCRTIIPIMADESVCSVHDAERLCRNDAIDYINIKFAKSAGIAGALAIQQAAAEYNIPCMIGGMLESRLGLAAQVHFAYAADNVKLYDLDSCLLGHLQNPVLGGAQYEGYKVSVSEDIGIGADMDQSFLDSCEKWLV